MVEVEGVQDSVPFRQGTCGTGLALWRAGRLRGTHTPARALASIIIS